MSVASQIARPAHGMPSHSSNNNNNKANHLLAYMKLRSPSDPIVHEKISQWVSFQKFPAQIHPTKDPTCRVSSALLLQRLVRAFENRLSSSSDDGNKTKVATGTGNRSNPSSPTNGNFFNQTKTSRFTNPPKVAKNLPPLNMLMQRKVKVTQLVQQAVQFVGSDVLKVLQVSAPSPTVADVANACLNILSDERRIKEFYRMFTEATGKDPSIIDESSSIYFGVFALQALQSLRAQAISAYEFSNDFEMIYRTCYQDPDFQMCMHELNPAMRPLAGLTPAAFAPDTEARNICWKMARLLALKYDSNKKSNPESKDHRRNHILISATSIILAANIGKAIKNEATTGSASAQKGTIPDNVDFVTLVSTPVSDLLQFLTKNASQNQGITPIGQAEIRSHVMEICNLINQLGIGERVTNGVASSSSRSLLAKAFDRAKLYVVIHDYRTIIQTLVMETQKELKINTAITNKGKAGGSGGRTGIANVLLFFPMVIGEPWGIHRDAPMITSKMLCSGENSKPSDPLKDSVAVVLEMKPRPKVVKRKAAASESSSLASIRTSNKKPKVIALMDKPKKKPKTLSKEPIDLVGEVSAPPAPKASIHVRATESDAPIVNDSSELNEWTLSILSLSVIKPTDSLLTYLGENDRMQGDGSSCLQDVIVPMLNRGVLRIQSAIRSSTNFGSEMMTTKVSVGRRDGQVYVNGLVDKNIQLCASVVGFYYYSLEAVIQDQMERMDFLGSFGSQLQSISFHRALLACCYSCILKGVGRNRKLQMEKANESITVQVLLDTTESDPFTFLKVIEAFTTALIATKEPPPKQLASPIISGLPLILYKHAQKIESQMIDSVLWNVLTRSEPSSQTCFTLTIKTMKSLPGAWPPDILEPMLPEEIMDIEGDSTKSDEVRYKPSFGSSSEANFLSFVLRKLLKCIFFRIRAMCVALNLSNESALQTQILVTFRYILRHHISMFNDRHVDQLLLCTIYGVCRVMKIQPKMTFGKVIDAYFTIRGEDQGERACRIIVRHVKLSNPGNGSRAPLQCVGNIVSFYNTVFIPKMQKYFLASKSLKKSTEIYEKSCKKREIPKEIQISEKKSDFKSAPNKSSAVASAAATKDSQAISAGASGDKRLTRKDAANASSQKGNAFVGNSARADSTYKSTPLVSSKEISGTNGVVGKPTTGSYVVKDRTANGPTVSGADGVRKGEKPGKVSDGKYTVAVTEKAASSGKANDPEKSINNNSQGSNKADSSEKASSSSEKPTLSNAANKSDSLTGQDTQKVPTNVKAPAGDKRD
jgi:hypothetical protein